MQDKDAPQDNKQGKGHIPSVARKPGPLALPDCMGQMGEDNKKQGKDGKSRIPRHARSEGKHLTKHEHRIYNRPGPEKDPYHYHDEHGDGPVCQSLYSACQQ